MWGGKKEGGFYNHYEVYTVTGLILDLRRRPVFPQSRSYTTSWLWTWPN